MLSLSLLVTLVFAGGLHAQAPPPLAPLPKIPGADASAAPDTAPVATQMAPPDVVASAVDAVAKLGDEVVLGRYKVALDRMNPLWKERTAKKIDGGMAALEKQLEGAAAQMVQHGITMMDFKPQGQPRSYEVGPGRKVEKVNGEEVERGVFKQWLVLVPTVAKVRIMSQKAGEKPVFIETTGFQVAISDKGKNNWSFIDGSSLSVNDLRGLYGTLPADMKFPPVEKREAR